MDKTKNEIGILIRNPTHGTLTATLFKFKDNENNKLWVCSPSLIINSYENSYFFSLKKGDKFKIVKIKHISSKTQCIQPIIYHNKNEDNGMGFISMIEFKKYDSKKYISQNTGEYKMEDSFLSLPILPESISEILITMVKC